MKERGIPFNGQMVRSILSGQKTQTRRAVHPQPPSCEGRPYSGRIFGPEMYEPATYDKHGEMVPGAEIYGIYDEDGEWGVKSPYGQPGDRLWVREAWRTGKRLDGYRPKQIQELCTEAGYKAGLKPACPIKYEADSFYRQWGDNDIEDFGDWGRYRHARFMPRWAARISLEVVSVRVERLQDISDDDCASEGAKRTHDGGEWGEEGLHEEFESLWETINSPGSWEANPWVWVIEFKHIPAAQNNPENSL